jgi:ferredoxin-NADP reductase
MARAAVLGRLTWRVARVVDIIAETPRATTIAFDVPGWPGHRAGQHVDVRLTAEDGYQAQRSYSIASVPDGSTGIELTVVRIDGGEVSPYLTGALHRGDQVELRGPVGGYFVWEPAQGGPLLLVAGGSGIAPLMAMLRLHARTGSAVDARLLMSSRDWDDIIYRDELAQLTGATRVVVHTLTKAQPPGWEGHARRVDPEMLAHLGPPPTEQPHVYVCGPTPFVETVAQALVQLGHQPQRIRTERFGATGE